MTPTYLIGLDKTVGGALVDGVIGLSDCRFIFRASYNLTCVCRAKLAPVEAKN